MNASQWREKQLELNEMDRDLRKQFERRYKVPGAERYTIVVDLPDRHTCPETALRITISDP